MLYILVNIDQDELKLYGIYMFTKCAIIRSTSKGG